MNRSLKERIIGAIVLTAMVVLIVPVFLDGPSDPAAIVSERVTLPGQNDQPRQRRTIVLERDRQQPVPAAVESAPTPSASAQAPQADEDPDLIPFVTSDEVPEAEPAVETDAEPDSAPTEPEREAVVEAAEQPKEPPAVQQSPTVSETGLWAVQLGSFSSKSNAEKLSAELRSEGYAAFLSRLDTASGELHRVRIGPQKDRRAAAGVARNLAAAGHKGQVVTHP